jgi:hypothetical protein
VRHRRSWGTHGVVVAGGAHLRASGGKLSLDCFAPLTSFSGNGRSKFRKEFKKSGTQTSQCVRGQSCTPLGKQFTPGPTWQQETNRAFASVPAWTAIVALHVYRASLKGKPAQMLDGPTGDHRGLLGWCKPGAVSCATTLFASRKRSALASALPSKRRRPENRRLVRRHRREASAIT